MANYLYNGVKLPALPEWDKETYPYAYIQDGSNLIPPGARAIILRVFEVPVYAIGNAVSTTAATNSITWKCPITDAVEWTGRTETTYEADASCGGNAIWTNADILNMDGTLYLAASDPIPVGEPIDKASFMQGYIVGRRLAGMRK